MRDVGEVPKIAVWHTLKEKYKKEKIEKISNKSGEFTKEEDILEQARLFYKKLYKKGERAEKSKKMSEKLNEEDKEELNKEMSWE